MSSSGDGILTESGCTVAGKPYVVVRWGDEAGQLTPAEARRLALGIIMAADAAEHDAALVRVLGLPVDRVAAEMLALMRAERGGMPAWPEGDK